MEKQLKDYLHLYLGCECLLQHQASYIDKANETMPPLAAYVKASFEETIKKELDTFILFSYKPEYIKPILRPLSDMTEEESIELFKKVSLYDLNECVFDFVEDEDGFYINSELDGRVIDAIYMSVNSDVVEMMNNDGSFSPLNPMSQAFAFFLSKHFDLFRLIEDGMAIDKTSL